MPFKIRFLNIKVKGIVPNLGTFNNSFIWNKANNFLIEQDNYPTNHQVYLIFSLNCSYYPTEASQSEAI